MRFGEVEDGGAVRHVPKLDAVFTRLGGDRKEALKLTLRIALVRLVGSREVAHYPPHPQARKPAAMVEEVHDLVRRDADAPHAGIDLEVYRDFTALAFGLLGQSSRHLLRADHRLAAGGDYGAGVLWQRRGKDDESGLIPGLPEGKRLRQVGHA